jgi:hypothetical protein
MGSSLHSFPHTSLSANAFQTFNREKRPIWEDRSVGYAVRDAIILQAAYVEMLHEARVIMDTQKKEIFSNAVGVRLLFVMICFGVIQFSHPDCSCPELRSSK